jgi:hypothetical protein
VEETTATRNWLTTLAKSIALLVLAAESRAIPMPTGSIASSAIMENAVIPMAIVVSTSEKPAWLYNNGKPAREGLASLAIGFMRGGLRFQGLFARGSKRIQGR